MNSFNHYSLGSIGDWMRQSVAGIDQAPGTTGYEQLRIRPRVTGALAFAEGRYDSIRGTIRSRWERDRDGLRLSVDIPANTTAEIWIPASRSDHIREGDVTIEELEGLNLAHRGDELAIVETGSGSFAFTVFPS